MHMQGVSAFRLRMPEHLVKLVDFHICQNAKKLIGYHCNVPWATAKRMVCQFCNPHTCDYLR